MSTLLLNPWDVCEDPDDPDLLARIHLGNKRDATVEEHALFDAIGKRRTKMKSLQQQRSSSDLLEVLGIRVPKTHEEKSYVKSVVRS